MELVDLLIKFLDGELLPTLLILYFFGLGNGFLEGGLEIVNLSFLLGALLRKIWLMTRILPL